MVAPPCFIVDYIRMGLFSRDTSDRMERIQVEIHASLSPQERYALGIVMSDDVRDVALAGLRKRYPALSQADLLRLYVGRILGWKLPPSDAKKS
jgi:hypothetical protein